VESGKNPFFAKQTKSAKILSIRVICVPLKTQITPKTNYFSLFFISSRRVFYFVKTNHLSRQDETKISSRRNCTYFSLKSIKKGPRAGTRDPRTSKKEAHSAGSSQLYGRIHPSAWSVIACQDGKVPCFFGCLRQKFLLEILSRRN
jgi:hypothetical protein